MFRETKSYRELITDMNSFDFLSMYEVSGQDQISRRAWERSQEDSQQNTQIADQIENSKNLCRLYEAKMQEAPKDVQIKLALTGLIDHDLNIRIFCHGFISRLPIQERTDCLLTGLVSDNSELQEGSFQLINEVIPNRAKVNLKRKAYPIIKAGINSEDIRSQKIFASKIGYAPKNNIAELIKIALAKEDPEVRAASTTAINSAPDSAQAELREMVYQLAKAGLASNDIRTQKACASMISGVPEEHTAELEQEFYQLIKTGLANENREMQKTYAEMIKFIITVDLKKELFELAKTQLGNSLIESPLYTNSNISKEDAGKEKMVKTGSETTLIGGDLKNKAIVRHIWPGAFLAWKQVYKDYFLWREKGFDYVPIEPIISFKLNEEGLVEVYSGILDLNLESWQEMTDDFVQELTEDCSNILKTLEISDVYHGHPHNKNFCLRFFRDKNGNVNFNKKPRVYLIDFDRAFYLPGMNDKEDVS